MRLHLLAAALAALSGSRAQPAHEGFVVTSDSTRLFFRIVGARGDTVVAIHGGPGVDLESIAGDFVTLAERHVVIFYDQRGAGRSGLADSTRLGAARQIQDLEELRDHFRLERMTLVAHSYGPLLAASYALAHPERVRRMVFFGPLPPRRGDFWQRFGAAMNTRLDSTARAKLAEAGRRLADTTADARAACRDYWAVALRPRLFEPDRTLGLIKSDLCASDPRGIRYGLTVTNRAVMASWGDWDLRDRLKSLAVPLLVVHGEEDAIPMDLVAEWATAMPHATLLKVKSAAHFPYAERPDFVWPAVERFFTGN